MTDYDTELLRQRRTRRITERQRTAEEHRAEHRNALIHYHAFRIAACLMLAILVGLGFAAVDELVRFLLWSGAIVSALAAKFVDDSNAAEVRIAKAAWLHTRLGL